MQYFAAKLFFAQTAPHRFSITGTNDIYEHQYDIIIIKIVLNLSYFIYGLL